jgi:Coenzyme PQQ synthesis protein D (PqqD)
MKKELFPVARNSNLLIDSLADETMVYDLEIDKAFCLNETCATVWMLCDGSRNTAEIARETSAKLNSPVSEEFVYLTLDVLSKGNLLIEDEPLPALFSGVSRRDAIRKIGLATAVALPVISALVAPVGADAASACTQTYFQPCNPTGQPCCINNSCSGVGGVCTS